MSSSGKVEAAMEIKAPANVYHDVISNKPYKVPSMFPEIVQKVDLIKGNWGRKGAVISWTFHFRDGALQECKEVIEDIDDSNMSTTFKVIEGDILKYYKSFNLIVQAIPKGQGTSQVNWTVIYEKLHKNGPEPNSILELLLRETKAVAANLMQPHT